MLDSSGVPRAPYLTLHDTLASLSVDDFDRRCAVRDRALRDQGITFSLSGEERPFPLDLVPRVVSADEWSLIEAGVTQRVKALDAFLADVYGPGKILEDGVVPRRVVTTSKHYHRAAANLEPPNGVRVHVAGIDLVRGSDGEFYVLEDNVRTPSGISYVVENRRSMARVFPELFATHRVRPVDSYPARLLDALVAAAPPQRRTPTVAVLTPRPGTPRRRPAGPPPRLAAPRRGGRATRCRAPPPAARAAAAPPPRRTPPAAGRPPAGHGSSSFPRAFPARRWGGGRGGGP